MTAASDPARLTALHDLLRGALDPLPEARARADDKRSSRTLDRFALRVVRAEEVPDAHPEHLRSLLDSLAVQEGWLQTTGTVDPVEGRFRGGPLRPLAAEVLLQDGCSLHLRHRADRRWSLRWIVREPGGGVGQVRVLQADPRHLGGRPWGGLRYEVAWGLEPDAAGVEVLRPRLARFAGFSPAGLVEG